MPLKALRRLFLLLACAGPLIWAAAAGASARPEVRHFDIPAGPAEKSLKAFATQAETDVLFSTEMVANIQVEAVKGDFTPVEAIGLILDRTGLAAIRDKSTGAFEIRRESSPTNPPGSGPAKKKIL